MPSIYKTLFLLSLLGFIPSAFAKYQVCSITINSPDEIEAFKEHLSPDNFEFIELLPSNTEGYAKHDSHWFSEACLKDYKCDILVISGHFGGTFFGASGFTLPTELMEQKSCKQSCPGILSQVKEIFLFGCNTLADKSKDTRTYQEYLKVLLDDGMARETAERVVASRYSPLESPFYERMNFIFTGSRTVYGFDQLSPLGKHIRTPLNNYFTKIKKKYGSYNNYFKKKAYDRSKNKELLEALKITTISQVHLPSLPEDVNQSILSQNKCKLVDDKLDLDQRVQSLENVFTTNKYGSAFFAIEHFLSRNQNRMLDTKEGRKVFRNIQNNSDYKKTFLGFFNYLEHLPYIKVVYLNILRRFRWIDSVDFNFKIKKEILNLIKEPNSESYLSTLLLLEDGQIKKEQFYFTKEELPTSYIQNVWSLLILEKLKVNAPHLQYSILDFCFEHLETEKALCYQALNTLAHIKPQKSLATNIFRLMKRKEDAGLTFYGLRALGQTQTEDVNIQAQMATYLDHEDSWIKVEALDSLLALDKPIEEIQDIVSNYLLEADKKLATKILNFFSNVDIQSNKVMDDILNHLMKNKNDPSMLKQSILAFKSTYKLSDYVVTYFYSILDTTEELTNFYFLLEVIPQFKTHDIGIYYRISQFYKLEDTDVKLAILDKISPLNWFHPEVQPELIHYLFDINRFVRKASLQFLLGLDNLEPRLLKKLQSIENSTNQSEKLQKHLEDLLAS